MLRWHDKAHGLNITKCWKIILGDVEYEYGQEIHKLHKNLFNSWLIFMWF
jgi:hypothetical protein